jgi:hypothetical protein
MAPPGDVAPLALLPANIPLAWEDNSSSVNAISKALRQKDQSPYPWKTIREAIQKALDNGFITIDANSVATWRENEAGAANVKITLAERDPNSGKLAPDAGGAGPAAAANAFRIPALTLNGFSAAPLKVNGVLRDFENHSGLEIKVDLTFYASSESRNPSEEELTELKQIIDKLKEE